MGKIYRLKPFCNHWDPLFMALAPTFAEHRMAPRYHTELVGAMLWDKAELEMA